MCGGAKEELMFVMAFTYALGLQLPALLATVQALLPSSENLLDYSSPQRAQVSLHSTSYTPVFTQIWW